jgi:hypothetical protein
MYIPRLCATCFWHTAIAHVKYKKFNKILITISVQ